MVEVVDTKLNKSPVLPEPILFSPEVGREILLDLIKTPLPQKPYILEVLLFLDAYVDAKCANLLRIKYSEVSDQVPEISADFRKLGAEAWKLIMALTEINRQGASLARSRELLTNSTREYGNQYHGPLTDKKPI